MSINVFSFRTVRYFISIVSLFFFLAGCAKKEERGVLQKSVSIKSAQSVSSQTWERLSKKSITSDYLSVYAVNSANQYLALALDSTVRIDENSDMWSKDLPDNWYGERRRVMLYLYDLKEDTVVKLVECEQIVNFYDKQSSQPVQSERWEHFINLDWSPDGKCLLVLKDRESEGIRSQDALLFTLKGENAAFLDVFPVWQNFMKIHPASGGTKVVSVAWVADSAVRVVFSSAVSGDEHLEVIFNTLTGKPISQKVIPVS